MPRVYYPIFLNLEGRTCLVIGGGRVAERVARALAKCGARARTMSPALTAPLQRPAEGATIGLVALDCAEGDPAGAVAASDERDVNSRVREEASPSWWIRRRGALSSRPTQWTDERSSGAEPVRKWRPF